MKIIHVITTMQKAAGTSVFCGEVCNVLAAAGHEATIAVVNPDATDSYQLDLRIKLISISSLLTNDYRLTANDCIIHLHGLWNTLLHKVSRFAKKNDIPVVWSTHGMTAPWSMRHKMWKKLPAWWLYQKRDLKRAAGIHCTTEQEVGWNKSLGFTNCFTAPLGTHIPFPAPTTTATASIPTTTKNYTLLFVGRIYPVKGLVNLIRAWKLVKSQAPNSQDLTIPLYRYNSNLQLNHNWKLRIVGPDEAGHQAELVSLVRELNLVDSVEFPGPKFGDELSAEYENCDCLVLPSFTENFGATIVDALAHYKPCIASTFTPWSELQECGCGWWVSNDPEPLASVIKEMMTLDDAARRLMGEKGRRLVEDKYTWGAVATKMIWVYKDEINART